MGGISFSDNQELFTPLDHEWHNALCQRGTGGEEISSTAHTTKVLLKLVPNQQTIRNIQYPIQASKGGSGRGSALLQSLGGTKLEQQEGVRELLSGGMPPIPEEMIPSSPLLVARTTRSLWIISRASLVVASRYLSLDVLDGQACEFLRARQLGVIERG